MFKKILVTAILIWQINIITTDFDRMLGGGVKKPNIVSYSTTFVSKN